MNVAVGRLLYTIGALAIAVSASILLQPWFQGNEEARSVIATVFSILSGFLIAVMAMQADDRLLRGRTWRHDVLTLKSIRGNLLRHKLTFYLYLLVLLTILIASLNLPFSPVWQQRFDVASLAAAMWALLLSFRLPSVIVNSHMQNLAKEIRSRQGQD